MIPTMPVERIRRVAREVPIEAYRLASGRYPSFVLAPRAARNLNHVPVFMFHSVERETFGEQLAYLRRNGYRTLTAEGLLAFIRGEPLSRPSVVLTFDDGHRSWYDVALPLLLEYGFTAIGFIVPHFIREAPDSSEWLSWAEIQEIERSGAMTFESHTARHDRVFIDSSPLDFFHPEYDSGALQLDTPWIEDHHRYTNCHRLGSPIYAHAPRTLGRPRYLDPVHVREACIQHVEDHGGPAFFTRRNWRVRLMNVFARASRTGPLGRYEAESATRTALVADFRHARHVLSERLNRPVRHLCYPWGAGSDMGVAASLEAGYETNFWVVAPGHNIVTPRSSPLHIPRVKDDYVCRLAGRGRRSLVSVLAAKMRRRASRRHIY